MPVELFSTRESMCNMSFNMFKPKFCDMSICVLFKQIHFCVYSKALVNKGMCVSTYHLSLKMLLYFDTHCWQNHYTPVMVLHCFWKTVIRNHISTSRNWNIPDSSINTMATDALVPCFPRTSAVTVLSMQNKQVPVCHKEGFQLPVPYQS